MTPAVAESFQWKQRLTPALCTYKRSKITCVVAEQQATGSCCQAESSFRVP